MQSTVDVPISRRLLSETELPAGNLATLLSEIRRLKRTGRLEIHFSQGSPSGMIKFIERQKE